MVYNIFLDLATGWGWLYKMVLILFEKERISPTKWFVVLFGKMLTL